MLLQVCFVLLEMANRYIKELEIQNAEHDTIENRKRAKLYLSRYYDMTFEDDRRQLFKILAWIATA